VDTSLNNAKKVIAGSDYIIDKIKLYYGNNILKKTIKLPLGVDDKVFFPISQGVHGERKLRLINIANCVPVKSHETLFKAIKIVIKTFPEIKLTVCGKDEKKYLSTLRSKLNLENNIVINDFVSHSDVPKTLNDSGIFVLSSLYESQNMSIIEAAFCGLPVISTDVGVTGEITQHIVKPGDYIPLADEIVQVVNNYTSEKKEALKKVCKLKEKYGLNNITEGYLNFYKELI